MTHDDESVVDIRHLAICLAIQSAVYHRRMSRTSIRPIDDRYLMYCINFNPILILDIHRPTRKRYRRLITIDCYRFFVQTSVR